MRLVIRGAAIAVVALSGLVPVATAATKTSDEEIAYRGTFSYVVTDQYSSAGGSTLDATDVQRASVAWDLVWRPDPSDPTQAAFRLDTRASKLTGTASATSTNPSDVSCSAPISGVNLQQFALEVLMHVNRSQQQLSVRAPVNSFTTCFGSPLASHGDFPTSRFTSTRTFDVSRVRKGAVVSLNQDVPIHSDITVPYSASQEPFHVTTEGQLKASLVYGPLRDYVALGDSFASGEGLPPLSGACHQSPKAYPVVVQHALQFDTFSFAACSGATVAGLTNQAHLAWQRKELSPATGLVTITIGGNNVGFDELIRRCVKARIIPVILRQFPKGCFSGSGGLKNRVLVSNGLKEINAQLPAVIGFVREKAPKARIMLVGYPYVFPSSSTTDCSDLRISGVSIFRHPAFTNKDVPTLHTIIVDLNNTIRRIVDRGPSDVTFVPTTSVFLGHDACSVNHSWFTGVWLFGPEQSWTLHPTQDGQQALASVVIHKFLQP